MVQLTPIDLLALAAMLVCFACERRSAWFTLAFAGSCALGSAFSFLQGGWVLGLIEVIWSVIALNRWRQTRGDVVLRSELVEARERQGTAEGALTEAERRIGELESEIGKVQEAAQEEAQRVALAVVGDRERLETSNQALGAKLLKSESEAGRVAELATGATAPTLRGLLTRLARRRLGK